MKCRICSADSDEEFTAEILDKYVCKYYFCNACGFLFTEEPYWLDEAYESAIVSADTGLVVRNVVLSRRVSTLIYFLDRGRGKYLDAAGGYGMFTRMMRDVGFDFYWSDKYCQNLLARGFEVATTEPPFSAVTAFEVLEHVADPVAFIREILAETQSRTLIFSTELFDGRPPQRDWWYYSFKTGQHISFYQRRTLAAIAAKLGLHCYSHGSLHMFTERKISPTAYRVLTGWGSSRLLSVLPTFALTSKVGSDRLHALGEG